MWRIRIRLFVFLLSSCELELLVSVWKFHWYIPYSYRLLIWNKALWVSEGIFSMLYHVIFIKQILCYCYCYLHFKPFSLITIGGRLVYENSIDIFRIHIPIINSNKALWVSEAIISMLYHDIFFLNPTLSAIPIKQLEQPKKWKKKMMKINKWFVNKFFMNLFWKMKGRRKRDYCICRKYNRRDR